jgi:hypothetical protein
MLSLASLRLEPWQQPAFSSGPSELIAFCCKHLSKLHAAVQRQTHGLDVAYLFPSSTWLTLTMQAHFIWRFGQALFASAWLLSVFENGVYGMDNTDMPLAFTSLEGHDKAMQD